MIGFTGALGVVPLADSVDAKSESLGMEFARLGAGSGFGLGGNGGDFSLLLEPVMDLNDGQYSDDVTLSIIEGCRPLSADEDLGTSSLEVSCGELDSPDAAGAASVGACEDDIRPPVTPVDEDILKSGVS